MNDYRQEFPIGYSHDATTEGTAMNSRHWDGKTVHIQPQATARDRRSFEIGVTPDTARDLALALRRLKQTTFGLQSGVQELLDALDYVLVGDPQSVFRHSRMQAGKGMEPAGGDPSSYLYPDHTFIPHKHPTEGEPDRCGYARSRNDATTFCWRTKEEHVCPPRPFRSTEEKRETK